MTKKNSDGLMRALQSDGTRKYLLLEAREPCAIRLIFGNPHTFISHVKKDMQPIRTACSCFHGRKYN